MKYCDKGPKYFKNSEKRYFIEQSGKIFGGVQYFSWAQMNA